uniref:Myomesin 3 n=1 Tax=Nothobranchius furzeri TaxID=105023 RepID=A0A8C6PES1_NOTFU
MNCFIFVREIMQEALDADADYRREKWTRFGNEAEKFELDVIRNQRVLRTHIDRKALREEAERKKSAHIQYLEKLSQKAPDFAIPLRAHTVWEGMTVKLSCKVRGHPPPVSCLRVCCHSAGVQLHPSNNVDIKTLDDKATVTLRAAHKEHEGVYTARLKTRDGIQEREAFVYIKDASGSVRGGPASPLEMEVSDVNKDYVFLTWQPPSADGASPVEGYFVESQGEWVRCNVNIQKTCHFPVFGLKEGTLYQFRVCAVNQAGPGRPSKATEPVLTTDPLEHTRTMAVKVDQERTITITKDELEGQVKAPFPPTSVRACEVSDSYVVLSWTEPEPRGREPLTFYVEQSLADRNSWGLASLDTLVNSPRFPVFDLVKEKQYRFRVRSINKYGVSDLSEPSEPIAVPNPPPSVLAIRDTDTSVLLLWQEPKDKDGILGYYLYYSEVGKQDWKTVNNKPVTKSRFTVHGLKTWTEYVFRVKSVSRAGNSRYSDESQPIAVKSAINVPSCPSAIALLLCTGSDMVLGWKAPSSNGGNPVLGYYLDQREKGEELWREVNVKSTKERKYKVSNLTSGHFYQFRVTAANVVGIGRPSDASEAFLCEKWTMPEPGCPHDLEFREVRNGSLVLLWVTPLYEGQSPVTGYFLEISRATSQTAGLPSTKIQSLTRVSDLQRGQTYRFRVSAVNEAGVGPASLPSEPVVANTRPGTKDIEIGVDEDGFIFLGYEAVEKNDESEFLWSRNYTEPIDAKRTKTESKQKRSVLTFTDPSEEDLGLYAVEMSDTPYLSSSYNFTAEGKLLKSGWQVEVSERGDVRLWLQAESLSESAEFRLIFNDREISSSPHHKINFNKAKGLVEILFDQLSEDDEGSYTAQLKDGRAKNQCTLVFVDQSMSFIHSNTKLPHCLSYVSEEKVNLICVHYSLRKQVANTKKDTSFKWFKEDMEIKEVVYDQESGVSSLAIPQVFKSTFLSRSGSKNFCFFRISASDDVCMFEGFYKKTLLSSPSSGLKLSIPGNERSNEEFCMQKVWIDVSNPSENDRGKYTLEMFDGKDTHKRYFELSAEVFAEALLEHQRLNYFCIFLFPDRAKVTKGLPDVVAIMEDKSLCLTCYFDGDPAPEIFWLHNDRKILDQTQFTITKETKRSSLTIHKVHMEDSGKYSILVRNQYGSETADVTVSVYKEGEKPPANAVEMG